MRKEYHKLVRDRIPEIIEGEGKAFEVRGLDEAAYREALRRKVVEEAREIADAPGEELAKEIGDLYEVLDAVIAAYGLSGEVVRAVQGRRRRERGGLTGGLSWCGWSELGPLMLESPDVLEIANSAFDRGTERQAVRRPASGDHSTNQRS